VPRGQREGSQRPYSRFSRPKPLLFLSSSSSIVPTRLSGPVPDPLLLRKSGSARNRTRTFGSVARNSDHYSAEAVSIYNAEHWNCDQFKKQYFKDKPIHFSAYPPFAHDILNSECTCCCLEFPFVQIDELSLLHCIVCNYRLQRTVCICTQRKVGGSMFHHSIEL
jgi:hypothetical protein